MADVLTQAQVVPTFGEFGEFETITGGDPVGNFSEYWPAGARFPRMISYTGKWNDITISRAYVSGRDNQLIEAWKRRQNGQDPAPKQVVKQFRNALGIVEDQITWQGYISDVKTPDGKAGDQTIAMISVTIKIEALM